VAKVRQQCSDKALVKAAITMAIEGGGGERRR